MEMSGGDFSMEEFICIQKENLQTEDKYFNRERTLKLLELYKLYKKRVGTFEVKSMKKLWEVVAREMSNQYKITISSNKCENRFKVLERTYKKVIDNNNQTGRGRMKNFEFESEMDDIFERKKNIRPAVLLSSDRTFREKCPEPSSSTMIPCISIPDDQILIDEPSSSSSQNPPQIDAAQKTISPGKRKRVSVPSCTYQKRNDILIELKNDIKHFYDRKDKREQEKLDISKKRLQEKQKKNELLGEYIQFLKSSQNKDLLNK
ncbi:unnamed protein product [Phaedon cochleariae]|uniref:Myb/SANT-like DNA-binding domain-containing protein n=1 Tax=Phaedon cochleariae TaxID=80249 RepID=A0A9P0GVB0_PHACE|nr:unnamed protein product [Phaedon cochleariae]